MIKNRTVVYFAALTLCVALIWAAVSAIGHFRQTTTSKDVEKATTSLDPNLDINFFNKLQQK